jgi:hypothetical protein
MKRLRKGNYYVYEPETIGVSWTTLYFKVLGHSRNPSTPQDYIIKSTGGGYLYTGMNRLTKDCRIMEVCRPLSKLEGLIKIGE